jgi:hypothetical protein
MKIHFVGLLYGRAGRLNTENGGFRPGQWADEAVAFTLDVDWAVLRLDRAKVTYLVPHSIGIESVVLNKRWRHCAKVTQISAPSIAGMQNASTWTWAQTIPVAPEQGVLLVLEPTGARIAGLV